MIDKYRLDDLRLESGEKGELARWVIQLQKDLDYERRKVSPPTALAAMDAEPVAYMWDSDRKDVDAAGYYRPEHKIFAESSVKRYGGKVVPLYAAQPAPVSVPEWTNEQCLEFLSIAFRHAEIKGDLELDDIRLGVKMVNGSRAAMLQGAEPVSNRDELPDGWVLVPVEPTHEMLEAGDEQFGTYDVYRRMIAASPQQK